MPSGASSAQGLLRSAGSTCVSHAAWCMVRVFRDCMGAIQQPSGVASRVELQLRYRRARCSTRQQLSSVCLVRTAPECAAACGGLRRLGRRRWTRHRSSRRRSARRRHLPSSHAIRPFACCTGHARPVRAPPAQVMHARAHASSLECTKEHGWVGYIGVIPPNWARA